MAKKLTAFEKQFVAARRSGAKDFSFGGKKYNTKLAGGGGASKSKFAATPKSAPAPSARPGRIEVGKVTIKPGTGHSPKTAVAGSEKPPGIRVPTPTPRPERPTVLKGKTLQTYDNVPTPTPKPTHSTTTAARVTKTPTPTAKPTHTTATTARLNLKPVPMPVKKGPTTKAEPMPMMTHKPPANPPKRGSGTFERMVKAVGTYRSDTGGTVKVAGSLDPSKRK